MLMKPEYAPAEGTDPDRTTFTLPDAPGARLRLALSSATLAPVAAAAGVTASDRFTLLDPAFVSRTCLVIGTALTMPNEMLGVSEVTVVFMAAPASSFPAPNASTETV